MVDKKKDVIPPKPKSKRERRIRTIIYIMIAAMLLSTFTAGLAMFI